MTDTYCWRVTYVNLRTNEVDTCIVMGCTKSEAAERCKIRKDERYPWKNPYGTIYHFRRGMLRVLSVRHAKAN